jgi:hypothetical protein
VKQRASHLLATAETDRLINAAAKPRFGAIEYATVTDADVTYFFEVGVAGSVCRRTGKVTFTTDPVYE